MSKKNPEIQKNPIQLELNKQEWVILDKMATEYDMPIEDMVNLILRKKMEEEQKKHE